MKLVWISITILFQLCYLKSSIIKENSHQLSSSDVENKAMQHEYPPFNYGQQCYINIPSNIFNNKEPQILKDIYDKVVGLIALEEQKARKIDLLENKLTIINEFLNKKNENINDVNISNIVAGNSEAESTKTALKTNTSDSIIKTMDNVLTSVEYLDQKINIIQSDIKYLKHILQFNKNVNDTVNTVNKNTSTENIQCRDRRDDFPKSCFELYFEKGIRHSGVYEIKPLLTAFNAYCDMNTDGGGWTVIQNRFDGSVNFYRNWNNYTKGFGEIGKDHEFWLGLQNIHQLTYNVETKLRIDLEDFDNNVAYAIYSNFFIGSEAQFFKLVSIGEYRGNAGDSLHAHVDYKFSTYDNDLDNSTGNCAKSYTGAWWYKSCHISNLNGQYFSQETKEVNYKGITWNGFIDGSKASLKKVKMMVRRNI